MALGGAVETLRLDDTVCAMANGGGYSEYAVVPASQCVRVPPALITPVQAACLPLCLSAEHATRALCTLEALVDTAMGKAELLTMVDSVFDLDEVVNSHRRMESTDVEGRVVLSLQDKW